MSSAGKGAHAHCESGNATVKVLDDHHAVNFTAVVFRQ